MSRSIAVVGSLNGDLTLFVDKLPQPGETVLTSEPSQLNFGGKGGNQAAAAAAFGGRVAMIGKVGDDDLGRRLRADLSGRGVDVAGVGTSIGAASGSATIAVERGGENLIIVDPGANAHLSPHDVADGLERAAVVLVQLEIPLDTVTTVVEAAGARVLLNPAPARPLPVSVLDRVGVLIVNRPELGALAGVSPPAETAALEPLARKFQCDVVVTLGRDGALIVPAANGRAAHIPAPAAEIRDTTGAGDCFCGALAALLAEGVELTEAARHAVAAATLSATAVGARGKLPGRGEARALAAGLTPRFLPLQ